MIDPLTRIPIWLALVAYAASLVAVAVERPRLARWLATLGLVSYLVHVAAAFHLHYGWSQAVAMELTDRRTKELTGVAIPGGLYANYLFTFVWIADVAVWWWRGDQAYLARKGWQVVGLHGFFLFMIVNGAVVFARGPVRGLGLAIVLVSLVALAGIWSRAGRWTGGLGKGKARQP